MAGFQLPGAPQYKYQQNGVWGTKAEHEANAAKAATAAPQTAPSMQALQPKNTISSESEAAMSGAPFSSYSQAQPSPNAAGDASRTAVNTAQNPGLGFSVDPYGNTAYDNQEAQRRATMDHQALLDSQRFASVKGAFGDPSTSPKVKHDAVVGNEGDARAVAFARAKDQAGRIARSSLTSIAEEMASKGISGSGFQALKSAGAISDATQPMQELTRDQLVMDLNRAADISDLEYTGAVQQRGQDLGNKQSYLSLLAGLY